MIGAEQTSSEESLKICHDHNNEISVTNYIHCSFLGLFLIPILSKIPKFLLDIPLSATICDFGPLRYFKCILCLLTKPFILLSNMKYCGPICLHVFIVGTWMSRGILALLVFGKTRENLHGNGNSLTLMNYKSKNARLTH